MRAFVLTAGCRSVDDLRLIERSVTKPGPGQVRIRLRAATLNARDRAILKGNYPPFAVTRDITPLSDGAGEVIEVGAGVTRFKTGDRVVAGFFQPKDGLGLDEGPVQLGGPLEGVLAEEIVLDQDGIEPIPGDLSFVEAACLPCAAMTAWNALMEAGGSVKPGDTVLALGTGGVSIIGLQIARAAGARVIVTSSSDAKIERAKTIGAFAGVNYRTHVAWEKEVLRLTGGRGADCILEVGGFGTFSHSLAALAPRGRIGLIGGFAGSVENLSFLRARRGSIHGIAVGTREMFQRMNHAFAVQGIKPVVDRVFPFAQAADAFRLQESGDFVGKIAIEIA